MKATAKLLVAALAAAGMASLTAEAAERRGGGIGHGASHGGGHRGGHWNGGHSGHRHWGGHRHWHGGWGYRSHWYGPRLGFYFGVPVAIGLGYWGSPYWDHPRETVVYREVIRDGEQEVEAPRAAPAPAPEPAARTEQPAPASGPLYMNYCDSAKAYYPKVTRCPEGWKFVTPTS